jgi:hypothetical protein
LEQSERKKGASLQKIERNRDFFWWNNNEEQVSADKRRVKKTNKREFRKNIIDVLLKSKKAHNIFWHLL